MMNADLVEMISRRKMDFSPCLISAREDSVVIEPRKEDGLSYSWKARKPGSGRLRKPEGAPVEPNALRGKHPARIEFTGQCPKCSSADNRSAGKRKIKLKRQPIIRIETRRRCMNSPCGHVWAVEKQDIPV